MPGLHAFAWTPAPEPPKMIAKFFAPLAVKLFAGLSALLLIAVVVQTFRASHYAAKSENCRIERENDRKAYELAQVQARQAQEAFNSSISARYSAIAEKTDAEHQKELADARSAAERYAATHRVRTRAAGGSSGRTGEASEDSPAPLDHDVPADAVFLTKSDYDLLVARALDDWSNYEWGQSLIKEGLAEALPEPAFGN